MIGNPSREGVSELAPAAERIPKVGDYISAERVKLPAADAD